MQWRRGVETATVLDLNFYVSTGTLHCRYKLQPQYSKKVKAEPVLVGAMKASRGTGCVVPRILNLGAR
jgi:hypothetical protein